MVCVIPNISEYVLDNPNKNHINKVNNVIKTLLSDLSDDEMHDTLDIF